MDLLAPISRHLVAPLWARWERTLYLRTYREMLRSQYEPVEIREKNQWEKCARVLCHAYETVPFWKERFDELGVKPGDFRSFADLARLPVLSKTDIRERGGDLRSRAYPDETALHRFKTSGSTGVPLVTFCDEACAQYKRAAVLRSDEWSGWKCGERVAMVWGNPKFRTDWRGIVRNVLLERNYACLDTLKMDAAAMNTFTDTLRRWAPSMLFGHAHSLYLYAGFLRNERPEVRIRPRAILSTCMVLHDYERKTIREVFDKEPTDRYGCEEVGLIACECDRHEGLHVNADCLHVELIDFEGNPIPPGTPNKPGRIVLTDLLNRAMPLLRYEVGDTASWAEKPCSCGRTLPLFTRIEGRVADYVLTKNGEYISGISLTENFACVVGGIAQLQIVQEERDRFTFNIVKGGDFTENSLSQIAGLVCERFGDGCTFECVFLEEIPREPSGKYRFCISKVKK